MNGFTLPCDATPDEVKRDKNVIRAYLGEPHGVSV